MQNLVCVNGSLTPAAEACVSVFDSGFMQGIGLFETLRAYNGRTFRLAAHLARLVASAQALHWEVTPDAEALANDVGQVLRALGPADARVRITVTTGSLHANASDQPQLTTVVMASPGAKYPDDLYRDGATVVLAECMQNPGDPTVGHKTTSYFPRLASLRAAHAQGALEALWFTPDGLLAEGAISSVFLVQDGALRTPPLDTPVLPGITRAAVLELAEEEGLIAKECELTLDDLDEADEIFLTNSMMEVMPVVRIGRRAVGNEKPGEITQQLIVAYGHLIDRELEGE